MDESCLEGQYWDILIKNCMDCQLTCRKPYLVPRCISYCESAQCTERYGHYYDVLLKKCLRCADICGRHPTECSQHCQTTLPPVTTKKFLLEETSRGTYVPMARENSTVLLYSLLALCMALLFSSLSLALAAFLRRSSSQTSNPRPKGSNHGQKPPVQPGGGAGLPGHQLGQIPKDFVTSSSRPADREPSDETSPTETCVCVHCFPDLKALGQAHDRPLRTPFSFYQQSVLPRAQMQMGGPLCTEESLDSFGLEIRDEAAVG